MLIIEVLCSAEDQDGRDILVITEGQVLGGGAFSRVSSVTGKQGFGGHGFLTKICRWF